MNIYLLRHAQAEAGYPDGQRQLTARGRSHARRLGEWLHHSPVEMPARVVCSPLVRARETLECVGTAWAGGSLSEPEALESLVPEGDPAEVVSFLDRLEADVLLVGHNPNIEMLGSLLMTGEGYRARMIVKTCVLLCFDWAPLSDDGQIGPAALRWMLDPRCL